MAPSTFILSLPVALPMPCLALPRASFVVPLILSVVLLIGASIVVGLTQRPGGSLRCERISPLPAEVLPQSRHNLEVPLVFAGKPKNEMARPRIGIGFEPCCRAFGRSGVAHLTLAHHVGPLAVILLEIGIDARLGPRRIVVDRQSEIHRPGQLARIAPRRLRRRFHFTPLTRVVRG